MSHPENISIRLSPSLSQQMLRLKKQSGFREDTALIQAAFEALDRSLNKGMTSPYHPPGGNTEPYMKHPGLGVDDYDT